MILRVRPDALRAGTLSFVAVAISALAVALYADEPQAEPAGGSRHTLALKETAFQVLRVEEDLVRGERLLCDRECTFVQGALSLAAPSSLVLDYTKCALVSLAYLDRTPARVLFLGLGTGSMPRFLAERYPETRIDVVEIDPEVQPLAERFFRFRPGPRLRVVVADAADFVRGRHVPYDLVVLDACFGPGAPSQLATTDFFRALRGLMSPGGVLVGNFASPAIAPSVRTLLSTMRLEFPSVEAYLVPGSANLIAIASFSPPEAKTLSSRAARIACERRLGFDLERLTRDLPRWPVPLPSR